MRKDFSLGHSSQERKCLKEYFFENDMKKIEYKIVPLTQKLRKDLHDKKFLENWEGLLSQWGASGWELVKVVPTAYFETSGFVLGGAKVITMQKFLLVFKKETVEE